MGEIKDLQYKEFTSDTNYNVIHFETKASQVKTNNNSDAEVEIGQAKLCGKARQAIINGNFDIWQRGTSFSMNSTQFCTADRWILKHDGTIAGTISKQTFAVGTTDVPNNPQYFLRINPTSASGCSYLEFYQPIEDVRTFSGEDVSFSFWAKADNSRLVRVKFAQLFGTGGSPKSETVYVDFTIGTTWSKYTGKLTVPSISGKTIGNDNHLDLCLSLPTNTVFTVDLAQLQVNKGGTVLPFCQKHIDEEDRLCKRYFEKSYGLNINPGSLTYENAVATIVSSNGTLPNCRTIDYEVEKRTNPTVTVYSPETGVSGVVRNYTDSADISVGMGGINGNKRFAIYFDTTQTIGDEIMFHWVSDAEIY